MAEIKLRPTRDGITFVAIVDDEDHESVSKHKWTAHCEKHTTYAYRRPRIGSGKRRHTPLHHFVLNIVGKGIQIDHINHNGLDCRKSNLREATGTQNMGNMRSRGGSSKHKGIRWVEGSKKWRADIQFRGKKKYLGYFLEETDAAIAYDAAAKELFKEFAYLNFPDTDTPSTTPAAR